MTRRITGAEARELRRGVGPFEVSGVVIVNAHPAAAIRCVADINDQTLGPLLAAAPDLAESLAAVEAERDALRALVAAYGQAHDARTAHSAIAVHDEAWFAERDELNNAVSDALAELRKAGGTDR